jgi:hypothetical protein
VIQNYVFGGENTGTVLRKREFLSAHCESSERMREDAVEAVVWTLLFVFLCFLSWCVGMGCGRCIHGKKQESGDYGAVPSRNRLSGSGFQGNGSRFRGSSATVELEDSPSNSQVFSRSSSGSPRNKEDSD